MGLDLDPAIASNEDFVEGFPVTEIEHETEFPSDKMSADYVGKSTIFPSAPKSYSSNSFNTTIPPSSLAIGTAVDEPMTIDSILENAKSAVN